MFAFKMFCASRSISVPYQHQIFRFCGDIVRFGARQRTLHFRLRAHDVRCHPRVPNARVQILRKSAKLRFWSSRRLRAQWKSAHYCMTLPPQRWVNSEKNQKVDCCRQNDTWTPFSSIALLRREMRFDMQCWRWQCLILSSIESFLQ